MVDFVVYGEADWVGGTPRLADILLPVQLTGAGDSEEAELLRLVREAEREPVLLEQKEEGSPCVIRMTSGPGASIRRLLVISEARTMEAYNQSGEYCGTARGTKDDRTEREAFYRKHLILHAPSSACAVKLLSLGGRTSVRLCCIAVGLQSAAPVSRGVGIDLQQVQSLVEELGTGLSPGAQNLMEMVQVQQKNRTASMGGFLPLLMGGGAFSVSPTADSTTPDSVSSDQNGAMSEGSASPDLLSDTLTCPAQSGHLTEVVTRLLKGQNPDLLPVLQRVCGQVTQLRLDDVVQEETLNGNRPLEPAMERHLQEMEKRLKEHLDRRLDALERKLEKVLLLAASADLTPKAPQP